MKEVNEVYLIDHPGIYFFYSTVFGTVVEIRFNNSFLSLLKFLFFVIFFSFPFLFSSFIYFFPNLFVEEKIFANTKVLLWMTVKQVLFLP